MSLPPAIAHLLHPFAAFPLAYLATLAIALVAGYLGIFIALKRTTFVGIALAEVSAAGLAAAFFALTLASIGEHERPDLFRHVALAGSVLFSIAGVVLFAMPIAERKISREAVIAVTYATASALSILFLAKSAQGLEDLKNVLAGGSVLFLLPAQLIPPVVTGVAIAIVHVLFFKEFVFSAFDPIMARTLGLRARAYDLLLFMTVGVAIAISLRTGGLLMVFAFLVIPAQAGLLVGSRLGPAFVHAVAQAAIGSAIGIYISDMWDLPTGPAVVAGQAALLLLTGLAARGGAGVRRAFIALEAAGAAAAVGLAVFAGFVAADWIEAKQFPARATHTEPGAVAPAAAPSAGRNKPADLGVLLRDLDARDDETRDAALRSIIEMKDPRAPQSLLKALEGSTGAWRVHLGIALAQLGNPRGAEVLVDVLASDATPFDRSEALEALRMLAGDDFGYDPAKSAAENAAAIERWRAWLAARRPR